MASSIPQTKVVGSPTELDPVTVNSSVSGTPDIAPRISAKDSAKKDNLVLVMPPEKPRNLQGTAKANTDKVREEAASFSNQSQYFKIYSSVAKKSQVEVLQIR